MVYLAQCNIDTNGIIYIERMTNLAEIGIGINICNKELFLIEN